MKQIIKTAGVIMDQLSALTGWKFIGAMKGDTCIRQPRGMTILTRRKWTK